MSLDVIERAPRICRHIGSSTVQSCLVRIDPEAYPMRQAMLFFFRARNRLRDNEFESLGMPVHIKHDWMMGLEAHIDS